MNNNIDDHDCTSSLNEIAVTETSSDNILLKEALRLHDQGVSVYLSDQSTNQPIGHFSEYDPINDHEHLIEMCSENPESNLNIAIDGDYGLLALAVGIGINKEAAEESLRVLRDQYGSMDTLGYMMPTGEMFFLFKSDCDEFNVKDKPGLALLKSCESLAVFPSVIGSKQVKRVGSTEIVRSLSSWVGQNSCSTNPASDQNLPSPDDNAITDALLSGNDSDHKEGASILSESNQHEKQEPPVGEKPSASDSLESQVCQMLEDGKTKIDVIRELVEKCNKSGVEASERKITRLVITIAAEMNNNEDDEPLESDTALLLEVADLVFIVFKDEHGKGHVYMKPNGTNVPIIHSDIPKFLVYKFRQIFGRIPKPARVKETMQILEMVAEYESKQISLHNRVATHEGVFHYDMGDARSIRISSDGWNIIRSPILFRRHSHQIVQVDPVRGGDAWKIFDFLNIKVTDQLLLLVYIISLLIPGIPHPVFHPWGDYGSAKSFLCTVINLFCDPTSVTKMILNKKEADAIQNFYKHYVTVLDNLSEVPDWLSDLICQTCTGGSFNKRKLYTDSDDIIFTIKHCVILNGLEMLIIKPDLMQRTITMHIEKPATVREESDVWQSFESSRAEILGGMLDILVKAIAIYPTLTLGNLPRMADFYKWGYAIAQAMDNKGEQFVKDYHENIKRQHEGVMHNNLLCQAVVELMENRNEYKSTVSLTLTALKSIASPSNADQSFPKDPKNLGRSLGLINQTLSGFGITYHIDKRQGKGTPITFSKKPAPASSASSTSPDQSDSASASLNSEAGELGEAHHDIPLVYFDEEFEVVNA